jgi:hypothetical protein
MLSVLFAVSLGRDRQFAIFPSVGAGTDAMTALLRHDYGSYSGSNLVKKYAPSVENDTKAYEAFLAKNLPDIKDKKISDMTDQELNEEEEMMKRQEGFYHPGTVQLIKPKPPEKPTSGKGSASVNGCPYVSSQPTSCGSGADVWL